MESPSLEQAPPSDGLRGARMAVLFGLLFAALAHSDYLSIQPERPRVPNLKGGPASQKLASTYPFMCGIFHGCRVYSLQFREFAQMRMFSHISVSPWC